MILKDIRNELLNRRELLFSMECEKNPGIEGAKQFLAENLKIQKEVVSIININSSFGRKTFLIDAFIYDSLEHKSKFEPKPKKKKEVKQ